jgi:hypothetical protein
MIGDRLRAAGPALLGLAVMLAVATVATAGTTVEFRSMALPASGAAAGAGVLPLAPAGAASVSISGYGYVPAESDRNQFLYVRLTLSNTGEQMLGVVPASSACTDDLGHRVAGAALFSGQTRLASVSLAPGGRDEVLLGFALPADGSLDAIRAVTLDLAYTYGGKTYTAQAMLAKTVAAAVEVPAPAPAAKTPAALPLPAAGPAPAAPGVPAAYPPQGAAPYVPPGYGDALMPGYGGYLSGAYPYGGYVDSGYGGSWSGSPWGGYALWGSGDTPWWVWSLLFDHHHRRHHRDHDGDDPDDPDTPAPAMAGGARSATPGGVFTPVTTLPGVAAATSGASSPPRLFSSPTPSLPYGTSVPAYRGPTSVLSTTPPAVTRPTILPTVAPAGPATGPSAFPKSLSIPRYMSPMAVPTVHGLPGTPDGP